MKGRKRRNTAPECGTRAAMCKGRERELFRDPKKGGERWFRAYTPGSQQYPQHMVGSGYRCNVCMKRDARP